MPEPQLQNPLSTEYPIMEGAEAFFIRGGKVGCLLLHGFTSSPFVMRELGEHLARQGYTISAPLLAGHGTTPEHLAATNWKDWVASAEVGLQRLRDYGCERIYLAGLSLGADIVLYLAGQHPDEFAGVVSMSVPLWIPNISVWALNTASKALPYFDKKFSDIADPAARKRQLTYQRIPLVAAAHLADFLPNVRAVIPKITTPTLIIYARKDHLAHPLNSMHLYSTVGATEKRLLVLHRSYHIVTVDSDKGTVFAAIEKFIGDREKELAA